MLRRAFPLLVALITILAVAGPAHAAKTYDDPWLEPDLQQMRVPDALDILARTPQHLIVGDVDSGARLTDPDLAPHLLRMSGPYTCVSEYPGGPGYLADPANGDFGCDFVGSGDEYNDPAPATTYPDGDPTDPYGHGTGTAAIIAGVPNNGVEGAGVAPNARVLPVRACYGGNPDCYNEPAADGIDYAIAMGARVINASWPPENDFTTANGGIVHANPGVLFVFAIGGTDQNDTPYTLCTDKATYPNVLCVGLANSDDSAGTTNAQTTTDVSAPGYAGVPTAAGTRGEFGYTSGATAHVSGAAALLRGIAPDLTAAQIAQVLVTTSRPVAGYATANRAGGIVDVAAAVRAVQSMDGLVTPPAGQGAPADSPNPFPATSPGSGTGGGPGGSVGSGGSGSSGGSGASGRPSHASLAKVRVAGAAVTARVSCPPGARCSVKLSLSISETLRGGKLVAVAAARRHPKKPRTVKRTVTLARAGGSIPAGRSATFTLRLSKAGVKLLDRRHSLRARLTVVQSTKAKRRTIATKTVALRARKAKKKH